MYHFYIRRIKVSKVCLVMSVVLKYVGSVFQQEKGSGRGSGGGGGGGV